MPTILLVEDELTLSETLRYNLEREGYTVLTAADGVHGIELARREQPDLLILDIMLPRLDGFSVCRILRQESDVPILMLTARQDEVDRIAGLELGADDYVSKPFSLGELLARIRVAQRHITLIGATNEPVRTFGDLRLDLLHRQVYLAGDELHLTPTEYELLKLLTTHAGKVLTHTLLLREVWGPAYQHDTQTLRVFVAQLRRKLGDDPARPRYILTEPGIGYRFRAPH